MKNFKYIRKSKYSKYIEFRILNSDIQIYINKIPFSLRGKLDGGKDKFKDNLYQYYICWIGMFINIYIFKLK